MSDKTTKEEKTKLLQAKISTLDEPASASYVLNNYNLLRYNPKLRLNLVDKCINTIRTDPSQLPLLLKLLEKDRTLVGTFLYRYATPESLLEKLDLRELARGIGSKVVNNVEKIIHIFESEKRYSGLSDLVYYM